MVSGLPAFCVAVEEGSDPLVLHDGGLVRVDESAARASSITWPRTSETWASRTCSLGMP